MSNYQGRLVELVERDPRYPYEAYEFVFAALRYTQERLGRVPPADEAEAERESFHVSGRELVEGIREFAIREFGLMARAVFRMWGIQRTGDFGDIVFNLVEARLMSKTDQDVRGDFENVFDLENSLTQDFHFQQDEAEWTS